MSLSAESSPPQPRLRGSNPYEQVINAPPDKVVEYVGGELHVMSRPSPLHGVISYNFAIRIGAPYQDDDNLGGWIFIPEPKLILLEDIVIPDIAGWRLPWNLDDWSASSIADEPNWVCEVLSPSTRLLDLGKKRDCYKNNGVEYLWFIDPGILSVEAFALKDGDWLGVGSASGEDTLSLPPFELVSFPQNLLWKRFGQSVDD